MPYGPTGVCLWARRGQVWGHTSSVSAERRVDHTNSMMATNTAMMRPQISTTKMPPMFSMPKPKPGPKTQHEMSHPQITCSAAVYTLTQILPFKFWLCFIYLFIFCYFVVPLNSMTFYRPRFYFSWDNLTLSHIC